MTERSYASHGHKGGDDAFNREREELARAELNAAHEKRAKFPAVEFDDSLTVRRKADREKMVGALLSIAAEYGFKPENRARGPRDVTQGVETLRGLSVFVWLNGESSQPNVFILHWHTATNSNARLAMGFADSVNMHHWGKATDVCHGWRELCACVRDRFDSIKDGSAFQ